MPNAENLWSTNAAPTQSARAAGSTYVLRWCAVAILLIVALSRPAGADPDDVPPGRWSVRVFGAADGLRNLAITNIVQDRDGFLWLSTDDGVYRFDGDRFTHFSIEDGLISGMYVVVGVGPDGRVCVGSDRGLVCWDGQRFSQVRTRGLPAVPVHTMVSFDDRLWVGTDGAGLYVQGADGTFVPAPGWTGAPTIRALWADAAGLVVGDGATVQLSSGNGTWRAFGGTGLGRDRVEGVLRDAKGGLWIRTMSGLWLVRRGATQAMQLHDVPTGYDAAATPAGMAIDPRGNVLIATDAGLAIRDGDHWRIVGRSLGMPATVNTLFVDREGTIWLGSAGLVQVRGRGVVEHYDAANGLPGDVVWSYRRDHTGTLWMGTNRCLARVIDGRWVCLDGSRDRVVRAFVFTPQGVFLGGTPTDLLYLDEQGRSTSITGFDRPDVILALALGPDGDLWIGSKTGLYRLPRAVPGPLEHVVIPGTRSRGRFASFAVLGDQLWTATDEGVAVLDHGTWHVFDQAAGLRATTMHYVMARADGRLCAAYADSIGLSCFRYDGHTISNIEHVGPADGLASGVIYLLGEDSQRRLWVGTGNGLDVVTPSGIDHFDERDGLVGNDSAAMAFLADDDGSLWFGETGGATHLLAQFYHGPPPPPRTAFLDGRLGGEAIQSAPAGLEVPHDRSALSVEFSASSMLDAKRIEYQVRLSPMESTWSATHQREARYPTLFPGTYRFEVRARIGVGSWGPAAALDFTILPAWWQTRWFLSLGVIASLLASAVPCAWWLRRRTRQIHARADAGFRAVIDLIPDLISVHRDGKLIYLNQANRRFLGLEPPSGGWGEVELIESVHPDDREPTKDLFRRARRLGPQADCELVEMRMRSADGSWRSCEVSAIVVEIGGAPTMVASGRDITERKRMREKLLVSDRMASLGTLAAGIAHEINNPLAYVAGNLEAMTETLQIASAAPSTEIRAELNAALSDARDGAERVRKIVHGLRSFSRPEQEMRAPLGLAGIVEAAIRLTSNEIRHRAQLVCELGAAPLVLADNGRLTQVLINLLVNAAHALPEGRSDANRITVRTRTDEHGRAVLEIEDTGKGIAPEVLSRVFDPFFTTKDVGEGTGLGLSICHGIITALGGQIAIESVVERGTLVRVVLPPALIERPAAVAEPVADASTTADGHRRHHVMLVDDEPMVAQTIERLLRRDYDITIAQCGQEAVEHITRGVRFDAIVSDVMMPNMTGIELMEELRRMVPEQADRVILLSGGAFTAQTRERLDLLGVTQLEKPVSAKQLRACVSRVASGAKSTA